MKLLKRISRFSICAVVLLLTSANSVFAQVCCGNTEQPAKYVFLFIGDGMGFSHVALTEAYKATKAGKVPGSEPLLFTQFPVLGMATTYSATNMITCSSAAATALASGYKTNNNVVGVYPDSVRVHQISYKLKELGYSIGIMTSVTIDHATPAGFYAHCTDRDGYYDIALQLPESGFDFFGGGGFEGANEAKRAGAHDDIYNKVAEYGYTVAYGVDEYNEKRGDAEKMILLQKRGKSIDDILPFVIGREEDDLTLKQVVTSAIDFLYNPDGKGFFMMCEGGKIDWSAHDHDMPGVIMETLDMDEAVAVAYEFYKKHPEETLIVVTADHETGGLTLGNEKGYHFYLDGVDNAVGEVNNRHITVDNYMQQEPLDSISKLARIGWTTTSHTGGAVPVFAIGAGSSLFAGRMNNTDIPKRIMSAMQVTALHTDHYYKRCDIFSEESPINSNDIVFLGNSLTEGGEWNEYFSDVNARLAKRGGAIRNRGISGDTFGGIEDRLDQILPGQPAKIFLLIGINDVSHNLSADSVASGIIDLVKRIKKESPKTKIYLESLLPINESFGRYTTLDGKSAMIPEINEKLKSAAGDLKVEFIDLYPLFLEEGSLRSSLTADGLHLNEEGYKIWSNAIRKYVK